MFQEWPTVSVYVDALVKHYQQHWMLPDIMKTMGVSNETLLEVKQLRSQATLGLLHFASYAPETAYKMVHHAHEVTWWNSTFPKMFKTNEFMKSRNQVDN